MFVKKMKINPQKISLKISAAKEDHIKAKVNEIKKNVEETIIPEPETSRPSDTLISHMVSKSKTTTPTTLQDLWSSSKRSSHKTENQNR